VQIAVLPQWSIGVDFGCTKKFNADSGLALECGAGKKSGKKS